MWQKVLMILYSFAIHAGNFYIFIKKNFSAKVNLLYNGRKSTLKHIKTSKSNLKNPVWIHCASLGEFEQGKPLIETIKSDFPHQKILLSFFSPSGYEIRKNYPLADEIIYLPSDTKSNIKSLIDYYQPSVFISVKYEFWWNLLSALFKAGVPVFLISGVFRKNDYFFKWWAKPFRNLLKKFEVLFVQLQKSAVSLSNNGITNYEIAGDTRVDSVIKNAKNPSVPDDIRQWASGKPIFIYGSIWMSDMAVVTKLLDHFTEFKHILVPHDVSPSNVDNLVTETNKNCSLYSSGHPAGNILIIDSIGLLSSLYSISNYVYIGGGFQYGIHNILEPTVFGLPVFFGPNHKKFNEAEVLSDCGAVFPINSGEDTISIVHEIQENTTLREEIKDKLTVFFKDNAGATKKILTHLSPYLKS